MAANSYIEAGLPNITGEFGVFWHGGAYSGSFNIKSYHHFSEMNHNNNSAAIYGFDASKSNYIYGNSTTVQPPAFTVYFIVKIA